MIQVEHFGDIRRLNGPGSCLWTSEIAEFPVAVTKKRFCESEVTAVEQNKNAALQKFQLR